MNVIEEWKSIKNYEGLYEVSSLGNVKSLPRNTTKGRILKQSKQAQGYRFVYLSKNGISKKHTIHRLVAQAFIPNPNNYPVINHKDGNVENNCVDNLEFCTQSHNIKEAYRLGLEIPVWLNKKGKNHNRSKAVNQYDKNGNLIKTWDCIRDASKELNIYSSNIVMCCKHYRGYNYVGGYKWEYVK